MRIVDLLIALATVLQVKDTGKSRERVKPVELLPQEKISQSLTNTNPPSDRVKYDITNIKFPPKIGLMGQA